MERLGSMMPLGRGDAAIHFGARRRSRRWPLHADIEFMEPEAVTGVVINASAGGLRVAVDQYVDVGALCLARIITARDHESLEHAEVVWARELPDGWLLGLKFVS